MAVNYEEWRKHGAINWRQCNTKSLFYNAPLVSRYASVIKRLPSRATHIVDIGCGDGYLSCAVARRLPLANVVGIDADSVGIELAQRKASEQGLANIQFMVSDSDKLPFSSSDFDVILMTDVIEHLSRPGDMLAEIGRLLKVGGVAIITTPNQQPGFKWDERHFREYTCPEFKSELAAFFSSIEVFGSWPMKAVAAWKAKSFGRIYLDLAARLGFNKFGTETHDPHSDYGQLIAVCRDPIVASSMGSPIAHGKQTNPVAELDFGAS